MTPIDIQVSRSKVSVEGQAYSLYVGEGGISVLQTSIFWLEPITFDSAVWPCINLSIEIIVDDDSKFMYLSLYIIIFIFYTK